MKTSALEKLKEKPKKHYKVSKERVFHSLTDYLRSSTCYYKHITTNPLLPLMGFSVIYKRTLNCELLSFDTFQYFSLQSLKQQGQQILKYLSKQDIISYIL